MTCFKTMVLAFGLSVAPMSAIQAEEVAPQQDDPSFADSLMEEGARLFFKGLQQEMGPALDSLQGFMDDIGPGMQAFLQEMGPKLGSVLSEVKDWSQYHAPEMLPNGDIIMRKKTPDEGNDVPLVAPEKDSVATDL